jgi:DNA polymerase elongation subunit (family B)
MAKYYDIDPETCSIDELKKAIDDVKNNEDYYHTMEQSAKTFINSVYGVFGTKFFNLCNTDIAESITLQGQHLIKFSVEQINDYFRNKWQSDTEAHKKIADKMQEMFPDFDRDNFLRLASTNPLSFNTLQAYGDTDSAYITLQPIIDACHIPLEQQIAFDVTVYECAMEGYLNERFDYYANVFNCEKNLEKFELEKISRTIIMQSKKHYMCDVAWVDTGDYLPPLSHVTYTGVDVVKGSTPEFCRKELMGFTEFVLSYLNRGVKPTQGEIVKKLREIKSRFVMQAPNDISFSKTMSNYENFIRDDKATPIQYFEVKENGKKLPVPIHVRAAAVYNNALFNKANGKYITKYNTIKSGDKVKYYYVNSDEVFGFIPDAFPAEFAPSMDLDIQFDKILLSPLNQIIVTMGYNEIPPTLTYAKSLF